MSSGREPKPRIELASTVAFLRPFCIFLQINLIIVTGIGLDIHRVKHVI